MHVETLGSGSPLLLIHGWGMHGGMWGEVAERLAEHCRVLTVDLPGHGFSSMNAECGMMSEEHELPPYSAIRNPHSAIDHIVDQLAEQFTEPLALCGWSLGGQIALRLAMRYPRQVNRLALVASTPCFARRPGWNCAMAPETLAEFAAALRQNHAQTLRRFLALQVRGSERERELLAALRSELYSRGEPDLDALQSGLDILNDVDLRTALTEIFQPVLVIAGARDTLTPFAASQYMADRLPDSRLVAIEGAAHAPFLSHPDVFVKCLMGFLHE